MQENQLRVQTRERLDEALSRIEALLLPAQPDSPARLLASNEHLRQKELHELFAKVLNALEADAAQTFTAAEFSAQADLLEQSVSSFEQD